MFYRYYGVQLGVALVGLVICVLAGLYLAQWLASRTSLFRTSRLSRLAPYLTVARLLADGFFAAVAIGFILAFVFVALQTQVSPFVRPGSFAEGFWLGLCGPLLLALSLWRFVNLPPRLVLGTAAGTVAALLVYRLGFGVEAGLGPTLGAGVGPEMGEFLGVVGGLTGAFVALPMRAGSAAPPTEPAADHIANQRRVRVGLVGGFVVGDALALVGLAMGAVRFPYVAEPLYLSDTSTPLGWRLALGFGLIVFGVLGGLLGVLAVLLAGHVAALRGSVVAAAGLALAIAFGLACGLSLGFARRYFGGPFIPGGPRFDPLAGGQGLALGCLLGVAGLLILTGLAILVARQARREHGEIPTGGQALVTGVSLALIGVLTVTLPYWYVPLFAVSIY